MSDSQRPHGLQPTRLLHPWDFPGKRTGVPLPSPSDVLEEGQTDHPNFLSSSCGGKPEAGPGKLWAARKWAGPPDGGSQLCSQTPSANTVSPHQTHNHLLLPKRSGLVSPHSLPLVSSYTSFKAQFKCPLSPLVLCSHGASIHWF